MNPNNGPEEKFLITLDDILQIFRKSKRTILRWALLVALIAVIFAVLRPIRYQTDGTFREKGVKTSNVSSSSVIQLLSGASLHGTESEAASLMTSRKILKDVVNKLHLQADLSAVTDLETPSKLAFRNLQLVWASTLRRTSYPVLEDLCCPLKLRAMDYAGEVPIHLQIRLLSEGLYEVKSGEVTGKGILGEPFHFGDLSFTCSFLNQVLLHYRSSIPCL